MKARCVAVSLVCAACGFGDFGVPARFRESLDDPGDDFTLRGNLQPTGQTVYVQTRGTPQAAAWCSGRRGAGGRALTCLSSKSYGLTPPPQPALIHRSQTPIIPGLRGRPFLRNARLRLRLELVKILLPGASLRSSPGHPGLGMGLGKQFVYKFLALGGRFFRRAPPGVALRRAERRSPELDKEVHPCCDGSPPVGPRLLRAPPRGGAHALTVRAAGGLAARNTTGPGSVPWPRWCWLCY